MIRRIHKIYIVLLLLLVFSSSKSWGFNIISEDFAAGTTPPYGWSFVGISTYTSTGNFGVSAPAIKFSNSNDRIVTPDFTCGDQLSFWLKGVGNDPTSALLIEGYDGTSWTSIANMSSISSTGTTYNYAISTSYIKIRFTYTKSAGNISLDDVVIRQGTTCGGCSAAPTTNASSAVISALACNAFNLSFTKGNGGLRLVVVSTAAITGSPANGTSYLANPIYASGSTVAASQYVVYNGTGNSVFITGLAASTVYYYKVFEYCNGSGSPNYLTSSVLSGSITTSSCTFPAGITAVYVDACDGGCVNEGSNELIWGATGSYAMGVQTTGPTLHYDVFSTPSPTTTYISSYDLYSSNITALNTAVGACAKTVFVDPNTQGYIPPNSKFLIAHSCMCTPSAYDFSALCNSGPIYVVFGNNSTWPCGTLSGLFGNWNSSAVGAIKYFDLDFTAWGVSLDQQYDYDWRNLSGHGNGDYILTSPGGGSATTYSNSACAVPIIILPIDLIDFYATKSENKNNIIWKVASEENIDSYIIEKCSNGTDFMLLGKISLTQKKQTSTGVLNYEMDDDDPNEDITYYRLGSKEKDGTIHYYKIISVDSKNSEWSYNHYQKENEMVVEFKNNVPKNSSIELYDLSGKLLVEQSIKESKVAVNTQLYAQGLYFVKITTPYKTENFKIIINNN